jgi:hypothetical protein
MGFPESRNYVFEKQMTNPPAACQLRLPPRHHPAAAREIAKQ